MTIDLAEIQRVALTEAEYHSIVEKLGREPNHLELGIFGAMWSEHCGYKHSRPLLRAFPRKSETSKVLVEAGEENAGVVDIGDGLAVAFKVESHNHPSAVEPYEGAATGVGGIVRDIFTMGARPIALLNSLRFGPLESPRNRFLFEGVVAGISGYGNCLGIPDVAGEVQFAQSYSGNPLVNAMCVGLLEHKNLTRARASGAGNTLMLVGSATGRDGIHGATFASVELDEKSAERRPAVQVGNPFLEKLLLEACLELLQSDDIVGLQDLGAAGLTSSSVEAAAKGESGVEIDVSKAPRREDGMTAYDVMLSESQERMLVVVKAGHEDNVAKLFKHWDLEAAVIGVVTDTGRLRIRDGEEIVADLPITELAEAPTYRYPVVEPDWLKAVQELDVESLPALASGRHPLADHLPVAPVANGEAPTAEEALLLLLGSSNIASRRSIYRQYDHQVQNNTVVGPGEGDAAVLRIKGTNRGIALSIDGNGRHVYLDPRNGGARAIAEAARNVVCVGAKPVAVTDCLNYGNPEKPDVYYQLATSIEGMAEACKSLSVPVISGNVSLYNESEGSAIYPTPIIGMMGILEDVEKRLRAGFQNEGDVVMVLGPVASSDSSALAGSEFLALIHGKVAGKPEISLDAEKSVQDAVLAAAGKGLLHSAHDCSDGGLAITLAESCILGNVGLHASEFTTELRLDASLFGESASRIVVSCAAENAGTVVGIASGFGVSATRIGVVGGDRLVLGKEIDLELSRLGTVFEHGLDKH